jgi:hypothetical protein
MDTLVLLNNALNYEAPPFFPFLPGMHCHNAQLSESLLEGVAQPDIIERASAQNVARPAATTVATDREP